jgi:hypothetical protein
MSGMWSDGIVSGAVKLPTPAIVVVAVLGAAELVLFIWALVDLIRRPRTSLLPRWAWLVLMIAFELLGPIFYLALGRGEPPRVADSPPAGGGIGSAELDESRSQRAVDMLYGPADGTQPRPSEQAPSGDPQGKPSQWISPARAETSPNVASPSADDDPGAHRQKGGA